MPPNRMLSEYSKNSPIIDRQVRFGISDNCSRMNSLYSFELAMAHVFLSKMFWRVHSYMAMAAAAPTLTERVEPNDSM